MSGALEAIRTKEQLDRYVGKDQLGGRVAEKFRICDSALMRLGFTGLGLGSRI